MILLLFSLFTSYEYKSSWFVRGLYGWGFTIKDSLLFVTSGYGVDVINISNPAEPQVVSNIMTPGISFDVKIAGNLVYICDNYAGIRIFDISNPVLPVELGHIDTPGLASTIFIKDTIAYVADDWDGLRIIDISDPANPVELGFYDTPGRAIWVDINDTLAYISDFQNGLIILNIKEPSNPRLVGVWQSPNLAYIWAVDVRDTLVYVSGSYLIPPRLKHFFVLNVSNPNAPFYISGITLLESPDGFIIRDTVAFICAQNSGVRIINIADPLNMYEITHIPGYHYYNLTASDSLLFTAYSIYGTLNDHCIKIYDISDLGNIYPVGQYLPGPFIEDVHAEADTLFVLALREYANIMAFSCAEPESITLIDSLILPSGSWGCLVYDPPYLYVGHGNFLSILKFTNNAFHHIVSLNSPVDVVVPKGTFLFTGVQQLQYGFRSYNITNPFLPQVIDSLPIRCTDMVIVEPFAYVVFDEKLYVVNIENPYNLFVACSLNTGHYPMTITKMPPYLIIGNGDWCLQIVDISQPTNPQIINTITTSATNSDCLIKDSLLFVGGSYKGVFLYDLSNPVSPILIDSCDTPGWAYRIAAVDNYLYVADNLCLALLKNANHSISENNKIFSKRELSVRPNPFTDRLNIRYTVHDAGYRMKDVSLKIYDVSGRLVKQCNHLTIQPFNQIEWLGDDNSGQKVSSGVYFIYIEKSDGEVFLREKVIKLE